jgi:hypothetical protein
MYEEDFSKKLATALRNRGYQIQRIESHKTGRGIPDLWIQTPFGSNWWELKANEGKGFWFDTDDLYIEWQPGQQSWMYDKYIASGKKSPCHTICCRNNGAIVTITMDRQFPDKLVTEPKNVWYYENIREFLAKQVLERLVM